MQAFVAFVGRVVTALFCCSTPGCTRRAGGRRRWTLGGMLAALLVMGVGAVALNGRLDGMIREADAAE